MVKEATRGTRENKETERGGGRGRGRGRERERGEGREIGEEVLFFFVEIGEGCEGVGFELEGERER